MKISFGNMTIDLNIFNLENQPNEPFDQNLEVNALNENFENETIDFNDKHEAEYEQMFQNSPNKVENTLPFESLEVNRSLQLSNLRN